jgi:hypothetical protein
MLNRFEKGLLLVITVLAVLCLIMSVKKCHAEIPDTVVILCPKQTTIDKFDTIKTPQKVVRKVKK